VRHEPGKVVADLAGDVLFDPGLAELRPTASDQLNQVLQLVNEGTGQVVVDGYTDVGGNETDNLDLSQRRCTSIQAWLVKHGVSPTRIVVNGHGSSNPWFGNPITDEEHQANRRVEITIYSR
jgi:OOP family OmpA-OmpF porin